MSNRELFFHLMRELEEYAIATPYKIEFNSNAIYLEWMIDSKRVCSIDISDDNYTLIEDDNETNHYGVYGKDEITFMLRQTFVYFMGYK